jgi:hypothetical protein
MRYAYRILVGTPEGKRPLWRPRRRWEDTIQMDENRVCLTGTGYEGVNWINLAQKRNPVAGYCEQDNEPPGSIKCGEFFSSCAAISFSRTLFQGVNNCTGIALK